MNKKFLLVFIALISINFCNLKVKASNSNTSDIIEEENLIVKLDPTPEEQAIIDEAKTKYINYKYEPTLAKKSKNISESIFENEKSYYSVFGFYPILFNYDLNNIQIYGIGDDYLNEIGRYFNINCEYELCLLTELKNGENNVNFYLYYKIPELDEVLVDKYEFRNVIFDENNKVLNHDGVDLKSIKTYIAKEVCSDFGDPDRLHYIELDISKSTPDSETYPIRTGRPMVKLKRLGWVYGENKFDYKINYESIKDYYEESYCTFTNFKFRYSDSNEFYNVSPDTFETTLELDISKNKDVFFYVYYTLYGSSKTYVDTYVFNYEVEKWESSEDDEEDEFEEEYEEDEYNNEGEIENNEVPASHMITFSDYMYFEETYSDKNVEEVEKKLDEFEKPYREKYDYNKENPSNPEVTDPETSQPSEPSNPVEDPKKDDNKTEDKKDNDGQASKPVEKTTEQLKVESQPSTEQPATTQEPTTEATTTPSTTTGTKEPTTPVVKVSKIKSLKLSNKKAGKLTINFKKVKGCKYEIQYSLKKNFKKAKKINLSGTSKTIKGLKKSKTYYVRVRAYKTVSGKKYYSSWASKKIKIKK